jgi:sugar phosphate isomerase/epimerase
MISVSSPVFSLLDFEMALGFINQHFDAWEVMGEGQHFLPEVEKRFQDVTSSYDMRFSAHAPMSDVNIGSLNPRIREAGVAELIRGLQAANRMGMDTYTFHPGFWSPIGLLAKEKVYEAMQKSLAEIDRAADDFGVRAALENMPDFPFSMCKRPDELFYLIEGTDIGACFDIGHANVSGMLDRFLDRSREFVNLHIHDNTGTRDEHLPIGDGSIDFQAVLRGLNGYDGKMVIESRSLNDAIRGKRTLMDLMDSVS